MKISKNNRRNKIILIISFIVIFSTFIFYSSEEISFFLNTSKGTGKITTLLKADGSRGVLFTPVFEFYDQNIKKYKIINRFSWPECFYSINDTVDIFYKKDNPENARIFNWLVDILLNIILLILSLICIIPVLIQIKRKRKVD